MSNSYAIRKDTMVIEGVRDFARNVVWIIKNAGLIVGALGLMMVNIITGPLFLGGINPDGSIRYSVLFWAMSFGLMAIQMVMWDKAWKMTRRDSFSNWWTALPIVGALVFMTINAILDIGFVTQLRYPDAADTIIFPAGDLRDLLWYVLVVGFAGSSLLFEPLLIWMLGNRSSAAELFDEYDDPSDFVSPASSTRSIDPLIGRDED